MEQWRFDGSKTVAFGLIVTLMLVAGCTSQSKESAAGKPKEQKQQPTPETVAEPRQADAEAGGAPAATSNYSVAAPSASAPSTEPEPQPEPQTAHEQGTAPSVAAEKPVAAKGDSKKPDELFKGWPKPQFAMLVTGQQMGYLEPCGCTGLTNQKGGLSRRHSLARHLADQGWPVVAVDVGNQVRRLGRQSEIKFQVTADALKVIGYDAIAFGIEDLRLSVGELAAVTFAGEGGSTPFVCANAAVIDRALTPTHHILEIAGKKIGVTAVLGSDLQSKIVGSEIVLTSPEEGLNAVMPTLRAAGCDLLILLAHASIPESQQLAQKYSDFKIVITAGGIGEPTFQPEPIPNTNSVMVQVGLKGMFAGVLGFYDDAETPWRYERVPLDARFPDSPEMLASLASYQEQLKTLGLEGLNLKPLPHPSGSEFVGSEKCGECHTKAYEIWQNTPHAHATETLVHPPERSEIARHFDPECLSCHVTGWEPQKYFPYVSGYLSLDQTPLMHGSGCENCHGPGSAHVAAESGEGQPSADMLQKLRGAMRLRLSAAEKKCLECHDLDNSPDFHSEGAFEKYWKQVEHKGLD